MKQIAFYISILSILIFSGCKKYEIIDSKPGESISPVTNLTYAKTSSSVTLSWTLPTSYPSDILQPASVIITIIRDGQLIDTREVTNTPVSYIYPSYVSSQKYKFIVKVKGNVNTKDPNFSSLRYSLGQTVEL